MNCSVYRNKWNGCWKTQRCSWISYLNLSLPCCLDLFLSWRWRETPNLHVYLFTSSVLYHLFSLCIGKTLHRQKWWKCALSFIVFRSGVKYDVLNRLHEIKTAEYISGCKLNSVSNSRWAYGLVLCCVL